jgi:hypothetical protein
MRFEIIQFIVPLAFLAIWALTALLNRDNQPLPSRPMGGGFADDSSRAQSTVGRVAPTGPARYLGAADRVPLPADAKPPARWSTALPQERQGADRRPIYEDGVTILESDSRGTRAGSSLVRPASRGGRVQSTKRGSRGRTNVAASPARPSDPAKPRALSGLVSQSLAEGKARPLAIAPLTAPLAPIDLPLAQSISTSVTGAAPTSRPSLSVTSAEIRSRLASPAQLREVAVLSEILQPPVSLRRSRRFG